jgi:hypothetical protein
MVSIRASLAGLCAIVALLQPGAAHPRPSQVNAAQSPNYGAAVIGRAEPRDFYLRVMPLGASITAGEHQAPEDESECGYRKFLRDKLRLRGWKVNMVGNFNRGNMNDNVSLPGQEN